MTDNPFRRFYDAGYHRLVPIVPPGAPLSPKSSLALRMAKDPTKDARGKTPGVLLDDGLWRGVDWIRKITTTPESMDLWAGWGAGVGIRTGAGIVAVDIDVLDEALADACTDAALDFLGSAPMRVGRWPKRLFVHRCEEDVPYRCIRSNADTAVELLTEGKQFVAHGIHNKTGKPYEWDGLAPVSTVTSQQLDAFFARLAELMPAATETSTSTPTSRANVDQAQLVGDPDRIARAMAALPNEFEDRNTYVQVGIALKAALPEQPDHALDLYQEWAAKWPEAADEGVVSADFYRMKPPFGLGAQYLYSLASEHGGFQAADAWFLEESASVASADPWAGLPEEAEEAVPLKWADLSLWRSTEAPRREWEVEGFIPRGVTTLVYGEGGVGKTLAMHQYAIAAAAGKPWLGQPTRQARVMFIACEDDEDELHRRHRDILRLYGDVDVADQLRIVSRAGEDNLIVDGRMQRTAFWHQINAEVVAWEPDVLILDTIADIYGGSEIDRTQVNQFVKVGIGALGGKRKMTRIALGHPSVAGRAEGRSGSTAWSNAARSRVYLRRPKGKEKGNARELEGMKANRGPVGNLLQIEWKAGVFALVAASTEIDLNAFREAATMAGTAQTVEEREAGAVLAAIGMARAGGLPLSMSSRSPTYAPRSLRQEFPDVMALVRSDDGLVEGIIRRLQADGRIQRVTWRANRNTVTGFEPVTVASVFD